MILRWVGAVKWCCRTWLNDHSWISWWDSGATASDPGDEKMEGSGPSCFSPSHAPGFPQMVVPIAGWFTLENPIDEKWMITTYGISISTSTSPTESTGVGIDVPTIGDLFHITFKDLFEIISPIVGYSWVLFNWDIYQSRIYITDPARRWVPCRWIVSCHDRGPTTKRCHWAAVGIGEKTSEALAGMKKIKDQSNAVYKHDLYIYIDIFTYVYMHMII